MTFHIFKGKDIFLRRLVLRLLHCINSDTFGGKCGVAAVVFKLTHCSPLSCLAISILLTWEMFCAPQLQRAIWWSFVLQLLNVMEDRRMDQNFILHHNIIASSEITETAFYTSFYVIQMYVCFFCFFGGVGGLCIYMHLIQKWTEINFNTFVYSVVFLLVHLEQNERYPAIHCCWSTHQQKAAHYIKCLGNEGGTWGKFTAFSLGERFSSTDDEHVQNFRQSLLSFVLVWQW